MIGAAPIPGTVLLMPKVQRTPPYAQVVAFYRGQIRSGRLAPGDPLPSTRRLAERWDLATSTAQRVLKALRDEGLVESRPGKPAVVRSQGIVSSGDTKE